MPTKRLGLSEDNKLVAFLERKSMNQEKEPAKRVIMNRNMILGGAVILGLLILAVYFKIKLKKEDKPMLILFFTMPCSYHSFGS